MTQHPVSRRRFLNFAASLPLAGLSTRAMAAAPVARWRGVALGASSQIVLSGVSDADAAPVFAQMRDEIARLEGIFSLYQNRSDLSRLNATGRLDSPAPEFLEVLSLSHSVWQASSGAFDPAVQPIWVARATGNNTEMRAGSFGDLTFSTEEVVLASGMALTFNGIAQGYITDRVAALLRRAGFVDLIVDAGEQRALGGRAGAGDWHVGISNPAGAVLKGSPAARPGACDILAARYAPDRGGGPYHRCAQRGANPAVEHHQSVPRERSTGGCFVHRGLLPDGRGNRCDARPIPGGGDRPARLKPVRYCLRIIARNTCRSRIVAFWPRVVTPCSFSSMNVRESCCGLVFRSLQRSGIC